jgi:hypothetical protein
MANIGTLSVQLVADVNKLVKGFEAGKKATAKFATQVKTALATIATGAVFNSLKNAILETVDSLDELGETAGKLGVSVEALQELRHVAQFSGVEVSALEKALEVMSRRLADAAAESGPAQQALQKLRLDAAALTALAPEQQFEAIAKALEAVNNSSEKLALAKDLFGNVEILKTMQGGLQNIVDLRKEARQIGIFSTEDAERAGELNDAIDRMAKTVRTAFGEAVAGNLEDLSLIVDTLSQAINGLIKAVGAIPRAGRFLGETFGNMAVPTTPGVAGSAFSTTPTVNPDVQRRLLADLDRRVSRTGEGFVGNKEVLRQLQAIARNTTPEPDQQPATTVTIAPANF